MSKMTFFSRRIFGGKDGNPMQMLNPASQADTEALTVGTTRRVFKGPRGSSGLWSYHVNNATVSGATSTLKFYFSDLPDPDPTVAAHWKDSGITAIDLTAAATTFAARTGDYPEWIMAEAVVVTSAGTIWAYVKVAGDSPMG